MSEIESGGVAPPPDTPALTMDRGTGEPTAIEPGRARATAIGFLAVLSWTLLAALTASTGQVPPLLLNAFAFAVASVIGVAWIVVREGPGGIPRALRQSPVAWALGVGGLFGYHALYFTALRLAPPVEASLIAYLWPLLIVVFASLLPGERLLARHVVGALLGLLGAILIVTRGGSIAFEPEFVPGYIAALACALVWSSYSVLSRLMAAVPTEAVAGFCLATAALSLVAHLLFETTVWPDGTWQWLAVLGLGLGPVGGAFYAWDVGCKRGDIAFLGASSYAAPVISTLVLIALGLAAFTWPVALACVLVTLGAIVASGVLSRRLKRSAP